MEKSSPFIASGEPGGAGTFYAFVSGERRERHGAPARAAWELERLAVERGWPVGELLGSEAGLRRTLNVSREALREAIRVVEGRGAMQMRRGRSGGLVLTPPQIERTAAAIAAYLRATGITAAQIERSVRGLDQLLAWHIAGMPVPPVRRRGGEAVRHWLARASGQPVYRLYAATLDVLVPSVAGGTIVPVALKEAVAARDAAAIVRALRGIPRVATPGPGESQANAAPARAASLAMRIVARGAANDDADLGNEAILCEQFRASRSVVRQALRILQDLDMIHVRLGRGGGYARKLPSPIGIIRQVFPWLAAAHSCPLALTDLMWEINAANLRLAGEALAAMPACERAAWTERLEQLFRQTGGSHRFIRLQQTLGEIADCPMIDTLARCVVSYQARTHFAIWLDRQSCGVCDRDVDSERAIVRALTAGDVGAAERALRTLQDTLQERVLQHLAARLAAE